MPQSRTIKYTPFFRSSVVLYSVHWCKACKHNSSIVRSEATAKEDLDAHACVRLSAKPGNIYTPVVAVQILIFLCAARRSVVCWSSRSLLKPAAQNCSLIFWPPRRKSVEETTFVASFPAVMLATASYVACRVFYAGVNG